MADLVYFVKDLLFTSKIRETAKQLALTAESARDSDALIAASRSAKLVIVDLRAPDALALLDRLAEDPATHAVPKVGFLEHERVELMAAAKARGCRAYAKGKFSTELPRLLGALRLTD